MPLYMLDTDTSSYVIKRSSEKHVKKLARMAIEDVAILVVSEAELFYGVDRSPRRQNDEAAAHYAQIRCALKRLGANDLFVAAHARALGLGPDAGEQQHWRIQARAGFEA